MYYTYIIRCKDNSLYTGMTNNVNERFSNHMSGDGAKYTKSHIPDKLEAVWQSRDKSLACKLEYQIKQLTKQQKEKIIMGEKISKYLKGKVDARRYHRTSM